MGEPTAVELEIQVARHNKLYWEDNEPVISDTEYDKLVVELKALSPESAVLQHIGGNPGKVEHAEPMLSLDKVYEISELVAWARGVARSSSELFQVNPKFDGIAIALEGSTLATRGDGYSGEDITSKIPYIKNMVVPGGRGEVVILKSELPSMYKTPRAAASGLINAHTVSEYTKLLTCFAYDSHAETCTLDELCEEVDWLSQMNDTVAKDYPTDGLVVSLADKDYGLTLGATDHHPRHSIALKYGNPAGETKLVDVVWQVGKHKLTPVGIVEPVEIDGYTNTRISLHNFDEASKVKLGDTVIIERCGQVIPQLKSVKKTSKKSRIITCNKCPACDTPTVYAKPNLVCPNSECAGMKAKLIHDSLVRLGVENIGPATVNLLVNRQCITFMDVFRMEVDDWEELPGFGKKKAENSMASIEAVLGSTVEDYKAVAALNIEGVGLSLAKKLCNALTLAELEECKNLTVVPGVGTVLASRIVKSMEELWHVLRWMKQNFAILTTKGLANRPLVVFTGKSATPRDEWVQIAASKGYAFHKGVNKKVTVVVTNDVNSTSTKAKKARKYGIDIITYEAFLEDY